MNEYFKSKLKVNDDRVILSAIVDQEGHVAVQSENKILVTLINIEKETIGKSNGGPSGVRTLSNNTSPANINLYVLFSAYFSPTNYAEALRFLSFIIAYFQNKNAITRENTPKLDARIEKLIFEMENVGAEKMNNIWSTMGAKYMPSVLYKVRMLTFDASFMREYRPIVSGIGAESGT